MGAPEYCQMLATPYLLYVSCVSGVTKCSVFHSWNHHFENFSGVKMTNTDKSNHRLTSRQVLFSLDLNPVISLLNWLPQTALWLLDRIPYELELNFVYLDQHFPGSLNHHGCHSLPLLVMLFLTLFTTRQFYFITVNNRSRILTVISRSYETYWIIKKGMHDLVLQFLIANYYFYTILD